MFFSPTVIMAGALKKYMVGHVFFSESALLGLCLILAVQHRLRIDQCFQHEF